MLPIYLKTEDRVLKARQNLAIEKIERKFSKDKKGVTNTLDVSKVSLGESCAILSIPDINLIVPVFYGTDDKVLDEGIGVLEGTSEVNGGVGKHCVLTGHNGLSGSLLFSNLPKIQEGAYFSVKVKEGTHVYKVNQILEIPVTELQDNPEDYIGVEEDKDYMTLITCTPRYINNKRLLVRGKRVKDSEVPVLLKPDNSPLFSLSSVIKLIKDDKAIIALAIVLLIFLIVIFTVLRKLEMGWRLQQQNYLKITGGKNVPK